MSVVLLCKQLPGNQQAKVWNPRLFAIDDDEDDNDDFLFAAVPATLPYRPQVNYTMSDEKEKRQHDDWASERKHRLPSFTEVLSRRTRPPVDLFMF